MNTGMASLARICLVMAAVTPGLALAAPSDETTLAPVTVIGATPLARSGLDVAKAPYDVRTLTENDLAGGGAPDLTGALGSRLGAVNTNENLDDPFQPDMLYRGFEASPVLGTPQGLAVYQNGVRVNEAFGDTVNWDLIPSDAVRRVDVVGTNPVYGSNALGGAVVVTMKDGFSSPGAEATLSGGAFGQKALSAVFAAHTDRIGVFLSARGLDQDGWRRFSGDKVRQVYGDFGWKEGKLALDIAVSIAANALHGVGATPVQELAVSRRSPFTSPQLNANRLGFVTLSGRYEASDAISIEGDLYYRDYRQSVLNGNTTSYIACADGSGLLCQADGQTRIAGPAGAAIPDLSRGGAQALGENDLEYVHARTLGGALQVSRGAPVLGRENHLALGAGFDRGLVDYASFAEIGVINPDLVVEPSGYRIQTLEGGPFTATPVGLGADNLNLGAFVTDTLDLGEHLSVTASGRYNRIRISLSDRRGVRLSGVNTYERFNPAIGLAWRIRQGVSAYLGYAEGSRAPTASEIECSDPTAPCLLPSSLSADPPTLKQVVSRTVEAGLRGSGDVLGGELGWSLGLYRTAVRDDIYAVATSLSAGYFQNIRGTLRQGGGVSATWKRRSVSLYASLDVVDATFDADLLLPSPSHPLQDANGDIQVRKGDRLPGIPRTRLKTGAEFDLTDALGLGFDAQWVSSQYYRGDEANLLKPIPGYGVLGLHGRYQVSKQLTGFLRIENALDRRYATFGLLGDPSGVGAPGVPDGTGGAINPRFLSPAAPIAVYFGIKASL